MILDKLMEKKDLMVYIAARMQELKAQMVIQVPLHRPRDREMVRRMFMGRMRELEHLRKNIAQGKLKGASKSMWQ